MTRLPVLLVCVVVCACSRSSDAPSGAGSNSGAAAAAITTMPKLETTRLLEDIKVLSSDEFEGRAPGSKGEELTVKYLEDAFKKIGLRPGNTAGTYIHPLPLVGISATNTRPLTVTGAGRKTTF